MTPIPDSQASLSLEEKQAALLTELARIKNSQDRFAFVITRGRQLPGLEPGLKTDAHQVEGCLSKLWFVPRYEAGRCHFQTDSDSAIVKGIAGILCSFYSDHTPGEILAHNTDFLAQAGINQHLTPNRRNGLGRIEEKIRHFAQNHVPHTPA